MPNVLRALLWASLMLLVALAGREGWIDEGFASGLMVVMPAMMVLSLRKSGCGPCPVDA